MSFIRRHSLQQDLISQHGVISTRQWRIQRKRLYTLSYVIASYIEIQPGSSIHQENKHHWVISQGGEGSPRRVCPYSPGCLCVKHVDLIRLDVEAEQRQAKSLLSFPCEGSGVPDAPAWQGVAGPQHIYCMYCQCLPHQDHPMGGCPQGVCHHLLLWKAHQALSTC